MIYRRLVERPVDLGQARDLLLGQEALTCWTVGAIIGAALIALVALIAYQRYIMGKKPTQHLCNYCGHMVAAVSDCHHAPVKERFLHGTCTDCKKDCRLVCQRCKRPL